MTSPGRHEPAAAIRRSGRLALPAVVVALGLAACGGSGNSNPGSSAGSHHAETGSQVFASAGCGRCHTLAAAHAKGTIGPNLDHLQPTYAHALKQVTYGGGAMPAFQGTISKAEIEAVAHFVATMSRRDG